MYYVIENIIMDDVASRRPFLLAGMDAMESGRPFFIAGMDAMGSWRPLIISCEVH